MGLLFFFQGVAAETNAAAGLAAGTGAGANASETLKPNAGNSAGTGVAANAGKTLAASIQASAGTGAATNATTVQSKVATAELASGTGAAAFGIGGVLVSASGVAAGGSAALDAEAGTSTAALASIATGTGAAANAAMSLKPNAQAALGTETLVDVATDAFGRSVSSGLGTADAGGAWTIAGTASAFNVASGVATFDHTASNQSRRAWLPAVVAHDVDQTFKWKAPATSGSDHHIFVRLRQTVSADGDAIMPKVVVSGTTMTLSIVRRAVAVETELASAVLDFSFEADTFYTIRARLLGQGIFAKVWKTSLSEPTNWQLWATDTQLVSPGGIGVATYSPPGATYPFSFTWDDLDSNEITGNQAYNATVAVTPEVAAIASVATGTGSSSDITGTISFPSAIATGTGDAPAVVPDMQVNGDVSAGTGEAYGSASAFLAYAGLPAGTGAALGLSSFIAPGIDIAEGGADAFNTVGFTIVASEVALGVGQAFDTTTVPISSFAGFGILSFSSAGGALTYRSAGGALTYRSAGAAMTIGGQ